MRIVYKESRCAEKAMGCLQVLCFLTLNLKGYKMPKMKTKSAVKKRFSLTGTGKIKRTTAYKRHCLACKTTKMKRQARGGRILDKTNFKEVIRFLKVS